MALKSELEASELAALWMPTTPEVEVKIALARQAGGDDELQLARGINDLGEVCGALRDLWGSYTEPPRF